MAVFNELTTCRVCGFDYGEIRWSIGSDNELYAQYMICPCCRAESGPDDFDLETVRKSRQEWIDTKMEWWDKDDPPPHNWDPIEQMKNIPPEWR